MKLGCILLAAGTSQRYGTNKMLANLLGKPLIDYILSNIPIERFDECITVVSNDEVLDRVKPYNMKIVYNDNPDRGIGSSIRLGIEALSNVDACMFCVSDQPMLTTKTITDMIDNYQEGTIYSLSHESERGNPVIFPSSVLDELANLKKGEFGTKVIYSHKDILVLHETNDETQLIDIDTHENLLYVKSLIKQASL